MRPSTFVSRMGFLGVKAGGSCAAAMPQKKNRPQRSSVTMQFLISLPPMSSRSGHANSVQSRLLVLILQDEPEQQLRKLGAGSRIGTGENMELCRAGLHMKNRPAVQS